MGLLDSLQIGASALLTHQAAVQVTGNNIANAATPGYTRQVPILNPAGSSNLGQGLQTGGGVRLDEVRRVVDAILQQRLNDANSQMQRHQVTNEVLSRIESLMNEMTDTDLSSAMVELFNSFSALAQSPQDAALRGIVVQRATAVSDRMHFIRNGLEQIRFELTDRLENAVREVDRLADAIAGLNVKVIAAQNGGGSASSLQDQRQQLIDQLSKLLAVNVREEANGSANISIGSEPLIYQGHNRGLKMVTQDVNGQAQRVVAFADNDGAIKLRGGEITGLQATRDAELADTISGLDQMASQLIWQVNRIHSGGTALEGFAEVTGTYQVKDSSAILNSAAAGLSFEPVNGSFLITVTNTAVDGGQTVNTSQISVPITGAASDMTLDDLVLALNAVDDVSASVNASGKLTIEAVDSQSRIGFSEDSSGVLAALGINTFFRGHDASSIDLNELVLADTGRIAAGRSGQPGDGSNAAAIAMLSEEGIDSLSGMSLLEYQQRLTADVATWTSTARDTAIANEVVRESLSAQRESLSGVSIDEEAVNLMRYQRAFQGAARFISVVNELLAEVLGLV